MKPLYLIPLYLSIALTIWWSTLPKLPDSVYTMGDRLDRGARLLIGIAVILIMTALLALIDWLAG